MKCGGQRGAFRQVCPACGHRPEGEGLLVAWLLSSENLDSDSLDSVAKRILEGESIRPSGRMLERARRALGSHIASDPGLGARVMLALFAVHLVLTPLVGWVLFAWWRQTRPRAALQALALAVPVTVLFTGVFLWLLIGGRPPVP